MKRQFIYITLPVLLLVMTGCKKDFLDRQPLSQISPTTAFRSETELSLYVRSFYDRMLPNADNDDRGFSLYNEGIDNVIKNSLPVELTGNRTIPVSGGGWSWGELRNVNYFIQNHQRGGLDASITKKYLAVAKFFRAYFYFNMVARFGDVPWYGKVIEPNDTVSLQKPRDPRTLIMDSVLADIDFAIANAETSRKVAEVTKWTALALKSRICLFEGTFRRYHTEFSLPDADKFLNECVKASEDLITNGGYSIFKGSAQPYRDLFASYAVNPNEVLLARQYSSSLQLFHNVNYYTITPSYGKPGLEKKLVNSYLMADGSRFTDIDRYDTLPFAKETVSRDPRLAQTIRTPGYTRINSTVKRFPDFGATVTGYHVTKYVTGEADDSFTKSYNPLMIFRFAEVLLNLAEAKAELGTLQQSDIDKTIRLTRDRVGMPNLDMAAANASPDAYLAAQYKNVSGSNKGVILEIRRERRVEFVMENFRWNDLMRWKEGHLITQPFKGMYFNGIGKFDLDADGKADIWIYNGTKPTEPGLHYLKLGTEIELENGVNGGNVLINKNISKKFDETKDYLYPVPSGEIQLNPALKQNPNWK
ncbi:RagB/SusD family nutrient uptake outer membrane protein [Paraflavitalea sp. CAU 1676]|uniref:RagB/SusD family nutrient uptake outer membrane protein n=1 Tax=Paraflavitalea sp. CAU 1676 TaxID=3032598 RepID=UPI0023DB40C7|nr:RagB/SusD family nutrient uptake outer membrane protein [Paraflavitalea sp. CAU 1676]MDF2190347.1 RagB/SusD family nutrient uptake outer membrane protein [Paraflavitalea sp. CAU 1676]